jgi:hypothetical protein
MPRPGVIDDAAKQRCAWSPAPQSSCTALDSLLHPALGPPPPPPRLLLHPPLLPSRSYDAILDCLERHGLVPNATLHHFVHPQWFEELGAFEEEANIAHFVQWATLAVQLFGHRIKLWATFNEPTVGGPGGRAGRADGRRAPPGAAWGRGASGAPAAAALLAPPPKKNKDAAPQHARTRPGPARRCTRCVATSPACTRPAATCASYRPAACC